MKLTKTIRSVAVGLLMAALTVPMVANAQQDPPPPGHGPMHAVGLLLHMQSVQQELHLSAQQIDAINLLPPPPPPGQGQNGDPLKEILSKEQMGRLHQLVLQFEAPMSMLDPRAAKNLNLTEQQRQAIDKIIKSHMPPPGQGHPGWDEMMQRKAAAFGEAIKVLNADQHKIWGKMIGKPFNNWQEPKHP